MKTLTVQLSEVCEINPSTPRKLAPTDPCSFVPMEAVDDWSATIQRSHIKSYHEVAKGFTSFAEHDVLIAKITPCMENGKCAIARRLSNGIGFGSTEFHVLRATNRVLPEWLLYFWRLPATRRLAEQNMTGSGGQQRVPTGFLEDLSIPLPPLDEQRRIAAQLEQADRLRRTRRYTLELSDSFLIAAFRQLIGDPVSNPRGWKRVKVSELGDVQTGGTPSREISDYYGDAVEWIKSDNIVLNQIHPAKSAECLSEQGAAVGEVVEAGAVLMTCIAGSEQSIGNVSLTDRRVSFNQQINAVIPHSDVNPRFLYALLLAAKPLVQRNTTLAMKRMITKGKLEQLILIKPPLKEQERIATLVTQHERLRATQRESLRQAEHLFQTLLHRAFADDSA